MAKHLRLQPTESIVFSAAAQIYAAYIAAGKVVEGEEDDWMAKSIKEATRLAITVDDAIVSDDEMQ